MWIPECELVFERMKRVLTTATVLMYPDFKKTLCWKRMRGGSTGSKTRRWDCEADSIHWPNTYIERTTASQNWRNWEWSGLWSTSGPTSMATTVTWTQWSTQVTTQHAPAIPSLRKNILRQFHVIGFIRVSWNEACICIKGDSISRWCFENLLTDAMLSLLCAPSGISYNWEKSAILLYDRTSTYMDNKVQRKIHLCMHRQDKLYIFTNLKNHFLPVKLWLLQREYSATLY